MKEDVYQKMLGEIMECSYWDEERCMESVRVHTVFEILEKYREKEGSIDDLSARVKGSLLKIGMTVYDEQGKSGIIQDVWAYDARGNILVFGVEWEKGMNIPYNISDLGEEVFLEKPKNKFRYKGK